MYDSVAILRAYKEPTFDEYGNISESYTDVTVFVEPRGVYNSEFYNAAQVGLKPSITFQLTNRADYSGQKVVLFEGKEYSVIRADWTGQRDKISLICEERIKNG